MFTVNIALQSIRELGKTPNALYPSRTAQHTSTHRLSSWRQQFDEPGFSLSQAI